jgi:hypothetical protein
MNWFLTCYSLKSIEPYKPEGKKLITVTCYPSRLASWLGAEPWEEQYVGLERAFYEFPSGRSCCREIDRLLEQMLRNYYYLEAQHDMRKKKRDEDPEEDRP